MASKKTALVNVGPVTIETDLSDASTTPLASVPPTTSPEAMALLTMQTQLMAQLQANQPKRKATQQEVIKRQTTWREFVYPVFQNGYEAQADGLSDETIRRAATVAPGRYMNDFVEVVRSGKNENQRVHLFYAHSTMDDRLRQKSYFTSFSDLLKKLHDEMQARSIAPVA